MMGEYIAGSGEHGAGKRDRARDQRPEVRGVEMTKHESRTRAHAHNRNRNRNRVGCHSSETVAIEPIDLSRLLWRQPYRLQEIEDDAGDRPTATEQRSIVDRSLA